VNFEYLNRTQGIAVYPFSCHQELIFRAEKIATELILGRERLREESNYDYSKLKRKGKERENNASYFTINTRCVHALSALLILRTLVTEAKSEAIPKCSGHATGRATSHTSQP
jgi:hypothetical protein